MAKIIPVGLCQCGCGKETPLATYNDAYVGYVKGVPMRFLKGHRVITETMRNIARENGKNGGRLPHSEDLMLNKKFGHWTVVEEDFPDRFGTRRWSCVCICGRKSVVGGSILRNGRSTGCKVCTNITTKPYEVLYKRLSKVAERRSIKVMSYAEFLSFTTILECVYCGDEVSWIKYSSRNHALYRYNLDKKENDLDYSKENCVVCCKSYNYIKSNKFTYEQMLEIGALIKKWRINEKAQTSGKTQGTPSMPPPQS